MLERIRQHWLVRQQRRHERAELAGQCSLLVGLAAIHAQLLDKLATAYRGADSRCQPRRARLLCNANEGAQLQVGQLVLLLTTGTPALALVRWRHQGAEGLHLGLRYLKGLPRPVWLRRAPNAQTHPGVLQSAPNPGNGWHHGLWLPTAQFSPGEHLWLQLANAHDQAIVALPESNLRTSSVSRHPLRLA